jgi:hypothetical protein
MEPIKKVIVLMPNERSSLVFKSSTRDNMKSLLVGLVAHRPAVVRLSVEFLDYDYVADQCGDLPF